VINTLNTLPSSAGNIENMYLREGFTVERMWEPCDVNATIVYKPNRSEKTTHAIVQNKSFRSKNKFDDKC